MYFIISCYEEAKSLFLRRNFLKSFHRSFLPINRLSLRWNYKNILQKFLSCQNSSSALKLSTSPTNMWPVMLSSKVGMLNFIHWRGIRIMFWLKDKTSKDNIIKIWSQNWFSNSMTGHNKNLLMIVKTIKKWSSKLPKILNLNATNVKNE